MSEMDEDYPAALDEEFHEPDRVLRSEALGDTIGVLAPAEPICLPASASVHEAVQAMAAHHQAGVLVVDAAGRLTGIFTERDVLLRVVVRDLDPRHTALGDVMTHNPEALRVDHRVAYALHCMSVAGYRTVPIVDDAGRPTGVVTASDVIRWLGGAFPESVLNLPPGDTLKNPLQMDAG
jgi:CBS domain-containing protein